MIPPPASALILKPGSLGDVIHALPVASAIGRARPECRLTWIVDPRWKPVLEGNPFVHDIVSFPRESFRGPAGWLRGVGWAAGLPRLRPDLAIDLQGLLRSALIGRATRPRHFLGLADAREGACLFYDESTPVENRIHSVWRYLQVCQRMGVPVPEYPEFPLPAGTLPGATPPKPYVLLHPFSRGRDKSLSVGAVQTLCMGLFPMPIVIVGGTTSLPPMPPHVTNLLGQTSLGELIALTRSAACVISVDSGPAHIAAAVKTPLLAIHTWSNPGAVGPFDRSAWIWQEDHFHEQDFRWVTPRSGAPPDPRKCVEIAHRVHSLISTSHPTAC
jgi:heptosyltransferase I